MKTILVNNYKEGKDEFLNKSNEILFRFSEFPFPEEYDLSER